METKGVNKLVGSILLQAAFQRGRRTANYINAMFSATSLLLTFFTESLASSSAHLNYPECSLKMQNLIVIVVI